MSITMSAGRQTITKILVTLILFFSFVGIAKADVAPPTELTTFYFQKDGQPFTQPVKFTVKCYGTRAVDNTNKLIKVSEFSETCQSYGCKFNTSNVFDFYRENTEYCDLEGETENEKFVAENFLGANMGELNCHFADYTTSIGDKYYKETQKYKDCQKNVYREYYPQGNGEVKGEFLCAKFETDEYLIPTTISTEPNGPCYRAWYTIKNNVCYQIPSEFFDCTAEEDRKMKICNQYLEDVTSKLAKDENGYPFGKVCEAKINILAGTSDNQTSANYPQSKSIFIRIIDFFRCPFLKLFGKSC